MHRSIVNDRIRTGRNCSVASRLLPALLFALGFCWLFRGWLFHHFDGIFGDEGDARILISILEHWHHVYSGVAVDWVSPPYFFPVRHVLGFTDAYFLYGLVYSALRAAGADPFTAFMLVMALLSAAGFFGFMRLARLGFDAQPASAAVGAFLFAFANMMAIKMGHAQSYCAMLLPIVLLLAMSAYNAASRIRAFCLAAAAGGLQALIFLTAYLTGWFATTAAIVAVIAYFLIRGKAYAASVIREAFSTKHHVVVGCAAGFALGIVPFLIVYLPLWLEGTSRTFEAVSFYAPRLTDLINVGWRNGIWGHVLGHAGIVGQPGRQDGEIELGYTPAVTAVCLAMTVTAALAVRLDRSARVSAWMLALGIAIFGYWLMQLDYFGIKPWYLVWACVPGAGAVRTTFRSQIVLALPAALIATITLDRIRSWQAWSLRTREAIAAALALLLIAEQINRGWPSLFSRAEQIAWLANIPAPPRDCRLFYLIADAAPRSAPWYVHQSDALLAAEFLRLPTVNGNSSWYPAGWGLKDPRAPDYTQAVRDWLSSHGLEQGACGLDPRAGRWIVGVP